MNNFRDKIELYSKDERLSGFRNAIAKTKETIAEYRSKDWDVSSLEEHLKSLGEQLRKEEGN